MKNEPANRPEELFRLEDVLEPREPFTFDDDVTFDAPRPPVNQPSYEVPAYDPEPPAPDVYAAPQEVPQAADPAADDPDREERIHMAVNVFNVLSIIVGVAAILVFAALLGGLFNWLRYDILHSVPIPGAK